MPTLRKVKKTDHIELVYSHHDLRDSQAAHEHDVLARLSSAIKTCLELTRRGAYYEKRAVRLGGTRYHVWNEVPMPRGVKYGDVPVGRRKRLHGDVHRDTSVSFGISPACAPLRRVCKPIGDHLSRSSVVPSNCHAQLKLPLPILPLALSFATLIFSSTRPSS